jgi:hypothetical protein
MAFWFNGRIGYTDAETIACITGLVIAAALLLFSLAPGGVLDPRKRPLRTMGLCVLCFGIGVSAGIALTAGDYFWLPLRLLQHQLHEMWGVPAKNLEPPR